MRIGTHKRSKIKIFIGTILLWFVEHKNFFKNILASIGFVTVISFISTILLVTSLKGEINPLPEKIIVTFDLNIKARESNPDTFVSSMAFRRVPRLKSIIKAIRRAANDKNVKAIAASINNTGLGLAQIQEIRSAVEDFKKSGKKTYAYSESIGTIGRGTKEYYLASAFEEIYIQPTGELGFTGIKMEVPFFRKTLEKVGITPSFSARYEYKSGVAHITEKSFTKAHKESLNSLADSIIGEIITAVAKSRKLEEKQVLKLMDKAPFSSKQALEEKLIDKIAYVDEVEDQLKKEHKAEFVDYGRYNSFAELKEAEKKIAVINCVGVINAGNSRFGPTPEKSVMGSSTISSSIRKASDDESVKAIVLRVNSPGGSYVASDTIRRAIVKAKEKGKKVVVSMSDMAASGGYFISIAADRIIAQPSTITGSIGVFGGKLVLNNLWKKLDVSWGEVTRGKNAGLTSINKDFSKSQKAKFNEALDRIYEDFTDKVGKSRNLDKKQIDKLARGRVWTGIQASKNGLVDSIGGVKKAVAEARKLADIKEDEEIEVVYYPKARRHTEILMDFLENGGIEDLKVAVDSSIASEITDVIDFFSAPDNSLRMIPVYIK